MRQLLLLLFFAFLVVVNGATAQIDQLAPHRIGIIVSNVDSAVVWYQQHLGCRLYKSMDFPEYDSLKIRFLQHPYFDIELVEKKTSIPIKKLLPDYDINKAPLQGLAKVSFRVPHIKEVFARMQQNKVRITIPLTHDKTFDTDFFMIEDRDGNMLQFLEDKSAEKHFIALLVKDLDASLAWYRDKFGFTMIDTVHVTRANIKAAILSWNGLLLEMLQNPKTVLNSRIKELQPDNVGNQGFLKLGFYVQDLEGLQAQLKSKGVKIKYPVLTADGFSRKLKLFIVEDNEGNMVQFYNYAN